MSANGIAVQMTHAATVSLALLAGCHPTPAPAVYPHPTAEEVRAIVAAEQFVARNGYTTAIGNPKHYDFELLEAGIPPSLIWEKRHDTLRPRAYGVSPELGARGPGWTVYFERTDADDSLRGVELTSDLSGIAMSHYDLRLDAPAKILRPRTPPHTVAKESPSL